MAAAMAHNVKEQHWQIDKSLTQCVAHMFNNYFEFNDVTFQVNCTHGGKSEKPESIRALQLLLLARSPVFYSMFTGDLATGEKPEIDIPDIEPQAFKELLRFIYTDEVELTDENVTGVLYASKKYMVTNLTKICVKFLEEQLSADTAPHLIDVSMLFEEDDLKEKVLETIVTEASAVLSSDDFCMISQQALHEVLQLNLKITKELEVFQATMKWAEKKCEELKLPKDGGSMREALGGCINSIRFTTMDIDEFNEFVVSTEVLTEVEIYEMTRYLAADTKKPALNIPFSTEPRNGPPQAVLPSIVMSDTTKRQLIIPGPYETRDVLGPVRTSYTFELSRPIRLNKLLFHAPRLPMCELVLSLVQKGRTIFRFNGYDTVATSKTPKHYPVVVDNIPIPAGHSALELFVEIQTRIEPATFSRSSVSLLSDDKLYATFPPVKHNLLLGFDYSLAL